MMISERFTLSQMIASFLTNQVSACAIAAFFKHLVGNLDLSASHKRAGNMFFMQ